MASSYHHNLSQGSPTPNRPAEPGFEPASPAKHSSIPKPILVSGPLPAPESVPTLSSTPAPKPESVPGPVLMNLVPVLLPDPAASPGSAPEGSSPITELSLVVYSKEKFQKLLRICMSVKEPFNNKPYPTLKACFPNLYFGKSYLDCQQFCQ